MVMLERPPTPALRPHPVPKRPPAQLVLPAPRVTKAPPAPRVPREPRVTKAPPAQLVMKVPPEPRVQPERKGPGEGKRGELPGGRIIKQKNPAPGEPPVTKMHTQHTE